ncbi:hypothetical protein DEU56DRAFT_758706 [Suillus clintonianus]|uniref:uncharacterized protein n=1 Tax=Suillus clintonianus TaxID=1904413 RepID=UPI001B8742E8|nr:uncharacterized protein DEU56DRAFT_758706 [Suillus clintonianus]KAG2127114.1 hypothetical protein DEU56DRAFT_758706 [Suillus clintonianus]
MAESDFRLFQKLLVGRELPALQQDAEYLEESHDSELESLATADEQLYQISSISPLARQYVSHRLPNSSDTEYEPGEEAYEEEQSDNGSVNSDYGVLDARSTARRKPSAARKGFRPGIHSDLNPSGQAVTNQLGLAGDRAATPTEYQQHPQPTPQPHYHPQPSHLNPSTICNPLLNHSTIHFNSSTIHNLRPNPNTTRNPQPPFQPPPQPQYHPQPPPQPQYHPQPPPQPQYHADRNEDRAVAEAYAAAFTLLRGGSSSRLPPQSDSIQDGPLAPWGAARLVALAPLHPGETIHGERTQGVIRTQKHLFDTGRRRRNARLPPTPEIPMAVVPNPPAVPIADPPISRRVKLSTTLMRKYKEAAKEHLRSLILNADPKMDGAPEDELRNKMIDTALQIAQTKIGQEEIEDIKGINHYMVASLADMRRSFKSYALNTVPDSEYLHEIEQTIDGTEIKRPLENKVLINTVIDLLKGGLSDVIHGPLDRLFAAYRTGQFIDVSVNSTAFDDAYHEIIAYITTTIRASHTLRERFDSVQQAILKRVLVN